MSDSCSFATYIIWTQSSEFDEKLFGFANREVIAYVAADSFGRIDLGTPVNQALPLNPAIIVLNARGRSSALGRTDAYLNQIVTDSTSRRCWLHVGGKNDLPVGKNAVGEMMAASLDLLAHLTHFSCAIRPWSRKNTRPWDIAITEWAEAYRSCPDLSRTKARLNDAWTQCSLKMGLADDEPGFLI